MKKLVLAIAAVLTSVVMNAASEVVATVTVTYNGSSATVDIPSSVSSYVSCTSGTSSHVVLSSTYTDASGETEIMYSLTGTSTDGEFYLDASYKTTIELNGLTLTNPTGPAINIQDGKRIKVSVKNKTTNTLADGAEYTGDYNGCFHSKGHTELKGKGTLNIAGNYKHAIYSKEYMEVKNCTVNITAAVKDGIHCKEYFLMESGTVSISGTGDDGIQVEQSSDTVTGETSGHEDENSGNFYQEDGTLTIANYGGKAIKADGTITYEGGTQNFDTSDTKAGTSGISSISADTLTGSEAVYDLNGRRLPAINAGTPKGIYIIRQGNKTTKTIIQ